ncbi:Nitrogen regulation protein NR(II) [Aquisphaera giovannonii]|uniref:histidine kinase n=1 Tax=Aquisphaera giovannonii TaxID=406548 RepID=A0A5B9WCJ4_9BACT|nr:HAMP domain-containing sensor histidine kinase [Aquisphaera giovannonii]QEH38398.1 Nitrogen regulation protein NR(II) [Aquisphaera giovannonii]
MFRSIRNQILIPIVAIQAAAVAAVALTAATLAARRVEREVVDRLNGVLETLGRAGIPYTPSTLEKMRGLSGAHFAVYDEAGRLVDATIEAPRALPPDVDAGGPAERLGALGEYPAILLDGTRYFAARMRAAASGLPAPASRASTLLVLYPETSWRQARREAATAPLVVGSGALLLMAGVTGWTAQRIGRRIQRLERQVARIAGGDFEELEPGNRPDEVRDLALSVNTMCGRLREMQGTIRRSERERLLAQVGAGLAHQLRNALTGARMSVQLHARRFPPPEGDETLKVAIRQLAMTEDQVKGLLSLGRAERRPPEACDARALLDEVAGLIGPAGQHARVRLVVDGRDGEGPLPLFGDRANVRAAVLNMALNAIEAAGAGGEVRLGATTDHEAGVTTFEIADDGPGPPPELAANLCEPFVTGKREGVGLGLALARQVAEGHGGRLEWTREGGITAFRLTLPAGEDGAKASAATYRQMAAATPAAGRG